MCPADNSSSPQQYEYRCVVVGGPSTGKSTLVSRLVYNTVPDTGADGDSYQMTTRVVGHNRTYVHPKRLANLEVLYLDSPGRALYEPLMLDVIKHLAPKCLLIGVYDVTNRGSLRTLEHFLARLGKQLSGGKQLEFDGILVGNKIDLVDKRIISAAEGQQRARMFKYRHVECSARDDLAIDECHQLVADSLQAKLLLLLPDGGGGGNTLERRTIANI